MTKILITGGTGFIGSHTVVELQQHGYTVIVADNLSNSYRDVLENIGKITGVMPLFEQLDLTEREATADFFRRHDDIEGIIHFAAYKAIGESIQEPLKYYHNNVGTLVNVLDGMRNNHINNIVFSSSCSVYGQPDILPVTESAPFKTALSPYGNTKQICEDILRFSSKSLPIRSVALRYFNPIGAHPSALIGELPIGIPNNLVPYIIQTAIGLRDYLRVFGNDYNTHDGTAVRDYIHVVDIAKAHLIALERMRNNDMKANFEAFNLGMGQGFSVLEVIKTFEKVSRLKLPYQFMPRRPGDIDYVWADTRFANEELGWNAEKDLDEMMVSAWKWAVELAKRKMIQT